MFEIKLDPSDSRSKKNRNKLNNEINDMIKILFVQIRTVLQAMSAGSKFRKRNKVTFMAIAPEITPQEI